MSRSTWVGVAVGLAIAAAPLAAQQHRHGQTQRAGHEMKSMPGRSPASWLAAAMTPR